MKLYGAAVPTSEKLDTKNMSDGAVKSATMDTQQKTLESLQRQQRLLAATQNVRSTL
jgi:hypothetical protein